LAALKAWEDVFGTITETSAPQSVEKMKQGIMSMKERAFKQS